MASQPFCRAASRSSSAAPQPTATVRTGFSGCAHHLQPLDGQELFQPPGKLAQRIRSATQPQRPVPWPSGCGTSGVMPCRPRPVARRSLTPSRGRIEGRVRTVDRHVGGDQVQQQSADGRIVRQPLQGKKRHGMMGDDQIGAALDCLARAGRRDGQAGHQLFDVLGRDCRPAGRRCPTPRPSEGGQPVPETRRWRRRWA